jgi:hypothetical protein
MGKNTAERPLHSVISKIADAVELACGKAHSQTREVASYQLYSAIKRIRVHVISASVVIPQTDLLDSRVKASARRGIYLKRGLILCHVPLLAFLFKTLIRLAYHIVNALKIKGQQDPLIHIASY